MAERSLPSVGMSPIDAYTADLTRPLVHIESLGTTDAITTVNVKATLTSGGNDIGVAGYFETHIAGTTSGHTYGLGSWINADTDSVLSAANIITPLDVGVYTTEAEASARIVLMQLQGQLSGAPATLHVFRVNTTQTITAVFAAANAGSLGFATSAGTTSTKNGDIAIADVIGTGVVYIRTYNAAG